MSKIDNLPPLKIVLEQYGLRAKKSMGQNFLLDLNLTYKIASCGGDLSDINVIEIGPGPGGLTRSLLSAGAKHVYAFEKDERCIRALQDVVAASDGRLSIIGGDALKTNVIEQVNAPRAVVANLPYNIATVLLIGWLKQAKEFHHMSLMFQTEVAERIVAGPNTKAYGRLSIMSQWLCETHIVFHIPREAFTPPPKVQSSVVKFVPRDMPEDAPSFEAMEEVVAAAFGQRRKMLRKSLKALLGDDVAARLESIEIMPTARAEDLTVDDFVRLAQLM